MLDWLTGHDQFKGAGMTTREEPPETPAHLFAVKAFKSALFGTPAPTRFLTETVDVDKSEKRVGEDKLVVHKHNDIKEPLKLPEPHESNVLASPAKGILLTPRTAATRRKTVSFSRTKAENGQAGLGRISEVAEPGAQDIAADLGAQSNKPVRRILFHRRSSDSAGSTRQSDAISSSANQLRTGSTEVETASKSIASIEESSALDMTIDLQQPRSLSGRHWMSEYQRDHNLSKAEMKRLIRYSQSAKAHAAKRDREAARLRERLQRSEARVEELENNLKELAVDHPIVISSESHRAKSRITKPDPQIARLERAARDANAKAAALERENDKFKRTILRVKEEMTRYEERHKGWVEQRRKKDERHVAQRKALKEKLGVQQAAYEEEISRVEAEAAREKAALIREIEFLRGEVSAASPSKFASLEGKTAYESKPSAKDRYQTNESDDFQKEEPDELQKRLLLLRVNEVQAQQVPREASRVGSRTHLKSDVEILKGEWHKVDGGSSPTILEPHLPQKHASGRPDTTRNSLSKVPPEPLQPSEIGLEKTQTKEASKDLPISRSQTQQLAGARKSARQIDIKPRHSSRPGTSSARQLLTPGREAAARLRILQRSAEKQKSQQFLFKDEVEGHEQPLQERHPNLL